MEISNWDMETTSNTKSITDAKISQLKEELRKAMKDCGMTTVAVYNYSLYSFIYLAMKNI